MFFKFLSGSAIFICLFTMIYDWFLGCGQFDYPGKIVSTTFCYFVFLVIALVCARGLWNADKKDNEEE